MVRSNRMRREWMNAPRHTYNHSTTQAASQQTFTRKLPQRAPGWGESSSSSEVGRKPIGQIRLCHFLTVKHQSAALCSDSQWPWPITAQCLGMLREALNQTWGLWWHYSAFISLHTSHCFSVCLSPNLPIPFVASQLQDEEVALQLKWTLT